MATAEVAARPRDPPTKRKPFASWVKRIANLKGGDDQGGKKKQKADKAEKAEKADKNGFKHGKKGSAQSGTLKNNPYPESGPLRQRDHSPDSSNNGQLSFSTPSTRPQQDDGSYHGSISTSALAEREGPGSNNRSGAPTLATQSETVHSDAGHSKAATATTGAGALSMDGAGAGSTFSSPNQSDHSLTTTLTTIQSQSASSALQTNSTSGNPSSYQHVGPSGPNPVMFSHQYPTSPTPSAMTASAIPRHVVETLPNSYNAATANNMLSDNASILTLASSSKRRRRSMDEDASVRAIPPSSVWGGSRESLPLSVLSGNADSIGGLHAQSRPSISGLASAERASVYSSQGVAAPALASERNSYYSHKPTKDLGDAKSLRSIGGGIDGKSQYDGRSINQFDTRSFNDARSMDVNSLRGYEGSVRSGALGHSRNDSIPGSIGSPLPGPGAAARHPSTSGALSRRSSDWQREDGDNDEIEEEDEHEHEREHERHGRNTPTVTVDDTA